MSFWSSLTNIFQEIIIFFSSPPGSIILVLLSLMVAIASVYYRWRALKTAQKQLELSQLSATQSRESFPFEMVSPDELPNKIRNFLYPDIAYIQRCAPNEQQQIDNWIHHNKLLIKGETGLGKTREAVELIKRLEKELYPEELTVLLPHGLMDVPRSIPPEVSLTHVVLFLDALQEHYEREPQDAGSVLRRPFHQRLQEVVKEFEERWCLGYDFRVIATVRGEPDLYQCIHPADPFWQTFTIVQLPKLAPSRCGEAVDNIATSRGVTIVPEARDLIVHKNAGAFMNLIVFLERTKFERLSVVTREMVEENFEPTYPESWDRVYNASIKPHPPHVYLFRALSILHQVHVPPYEFLVVELATQLWRGRWLVRYYRRDIRKAIDNLPWVQNSDGLLICHEAFLEGREDWRVDIDTIIRVVLMAASNGMSQWDLCILGGMLLDNSFFKHIHRFSKKLVSLTPGSSVAHALYASTLLRLGKLSLAEKEAGKALSIDKEDPVALQTLAIVRCKIGGWEHVHDFLDRLDLKLSPNLVLLASFVSDLAISLEEREEGVKSIRRILKRQPDTTSLRGILAYDLAALGRTEEAEHEAQAVQASSDRSIDSYTNISGAYVFLGNWQEAIVESSQRINLSSGAWSYKAYYTRALAYFHLGRRREAKRDFRKVRACTRLFIRDNANNWEAWEALALAEVGLGNWPRAIKAYKKALSIRYVPMVVHDTIQVLEGLKQAPYPPPGIDEVLIVLYHAKENYGAELSSLTERFTTFQAKLFSVSIWEFLLAKSASEKSN